MKYVKIGRNIKTSFTGEAEDLVTPYRDGKWELFTVVNFTDHIEFVKAIKLKTIVPTTDRQLAKFHG